MIVFSQIHWNVTAYSCILLFGRNPAWASFIPAQSFMRETRIVESIRAGKGTTTIGQQFSAHSSLPGFGISESKPTVQPGGMLLFQKMRSRALLKIVVKTGLWQRALNKFVFIGYSPLDELLLSFDTAFNISLVLIGASNASFLLVWCIFMLQVGGFCCGSRICVEKYSTRLLILICLKAFSSTSFSP